MTDVQRSLVLIKPDAVARGLIGNVLARYEAKGLKIVAMDLHRGRRGRGPALRRARCRLVPRVACVHHLRAAGCMVLEGACGRAVAP